MGNTASRKVCPGYRSRRQVGVTFRFDIYSPDNNRTLFGQVGAFGTHLFAVETLKILTQVADIWRVVEPYLAAERLELDDLELSGHGRGRVLRVTVDGEDVGIDRLAELSRGLSRLLDDEPALQDHYQLEVSSPGLERKLRRPSHYHKSLGREVVVKTADADQKKTYRGTLATADESRFTVETEQGPVIVTYGDVVSAKTVFRWEKAPKPGHAKENHEA